MYKRQVSRNLKNMGLDRTADDQTEVVNWERYGLDHTSTNNSVGEYCIGITLFFLNHLFLYSNIQ